MYIHSNRLKMQREGYLQSFHFPLNPTQLRIPEYNLFQRQLLDNFINQTLTAQWVGNRGELLQPKPQRNTTQPRNWEPTATKPTRNKTSSSSWQCPKPTLLQSRTRNALHGRLQLDGWNLLLSSKARGETRSGTFGELTGPDPDCTWHNTRPAAGLCRMGETKSSKHLVALMYTHTHFSAISDVS